MKKQIWLLLVWAALAGMCEGQSTNSFGIYLSSQPVERRLLARGGGDASRIPLASSPLLSAADLLSYDFTNHAMRLRAEALARIPRPPVQGTPFVVVADGRPIYLGVFATGASSMSFGVPSIVLTVARW